MAREDKNQEDDRTKAYGDYSEMSIAIQALKKVLHHSPNWSRMPAPQKESLDLIMTKAGRIITGDPFDQDSWYDIVGYAKLAHDLVVKELAETMYENKCPSNQIRPGRVEFVRNECTCEKDKHINSTCPIHGDFYRCDCNRKSNNPGNLHSKFCPMYKES